MAIQQFKCRTCDIRVSTQQPVGVEPSAPRTCPKCGGQDWGRVYDVQVVRPMHEHMNHTTGTLVSDMRGFRDALKRKSEEATLRTGVEHNYEPVDPADMKKVVEDSGAVGLDSTNRARHAAGERTVQI